MRPFARLLQQYGQMSTWTLPSLESEPHLTVSGRSTLYTLLVGRSLLAMLGQRTHVLPPDHDIRLPLGGLEFMIICEFVKPQTVRYYASNREVQCLEP